jgi:hypothetical protein
MLLTKWGELRGDMRAGLPQSLRACSVCSSNSFLQCSVVVLEVDLAFVAAEARAARVSLCMAARHRQIAGQ